MLLILARRPGANALQLKALTESLAHHSFCHFAGQFRYVFFGKQSSRDVEGLGRQASSYTDRLLLITDG